MARTEFCNGTQVGDGTDSLLEMCCPKVLPVGRTQLLHDWGGQVAEINPHGARGPVHLYVSTADKGKSEREK